MRANIYSLAVCLLVCLVFVHCSESLEEASPVVMMPDVEEDAALDAEADVGFPLCENAAAIVVNGEYAGVERCGNGMLHRVHGAECVSRLPRAEPSCGGQVVEILPGFEVCAEDSDCDRLPFGTCSERFVGGTMISACLCQYGCRVDGDCEAGSVCFCDSPIGRCVKADCEGDADCEGGALCTSDIEASSERGVGCPDVHFKCQDPADECSSVLECGLPESMMCYAERGPRACAFCFGP